MGCGASKPDFNVVLEYTPVVLAHRGMDGPSQNTRSAVKKALSLGYSWIELDFVLSKDGVLVVSHEPWLDAAI